MIVFLRLFDDHKIMFSESLQWPKAFLELPLKCTHEGMKALKEINIGLLTFYAGFESAQYVFDPLKNVTTSLIGLARLMLRGVQLVNNDE